MPHMNVEQNLPKERICACKVDILIAHRDKQRPLIAQNLGTVPRRTE